LQPVIDTAVSSTTQATARLFQFLMRPS
jgi:hypothetical protein